MAGPPYQQGRKKVRWEDGSVSFETPIRAAHIAAVEARLKIKPTSSVVPKRTDEGHVGGGVVSRKTSSTAAFARRLAEMGRRK